LAIRDAWSWTYPGAAWFRPNIIGRELREKLVKLLWNVKCASRITFRVWDSAHSSSPPAFAKASTYAKVAVDKSAGKTILHSHGGYEGGVMKNPPPPHIYIVGLVVMVIVLSNVIWPLFTDFVQEVGEMTAFLVLGVLLAIIAYLRGRIE